MGKKDDKAKVAAKKARIAAKQTKKAVQKEKKVKAKGGDGSDDENVDLEAVLEEYNKQQEAFLKVTEEPCEPPSPRSSATILASPANNNEVFVFGGELYNGAIATFYNDLFVYSINRGEWKKIMSPNSPPPRSGHAWCRGGNTGGIYLFGGEFSSPKQGTFHHFSDFWNFDPSSREWTRIETKGKSPPARSGHRMTYFKDYVVLLGGFQDTSQQTKYLQDLWLFDCRNYVWHNPAFNAQTQKPDPRSSFTFLPHDGGAVLFGGYARVKAASNASKGGKQSKGATKVSLKPMVYQDTWYLKVLPPPPEAATGTAPVVRWERRKRPANCPNPPRAGSTMAFHKGRGIAFGGVHDVEESEEGIESEFYNSLSAWAIDRNRFFPLALRAPRNTRSTKASERTGGRRQRGKADEEELLRNLAALQAGHKLDDEDTPMVDRANDDDDEIRIETRPLTLELPHKRFNAQLTIQGDMLFIFGGTYEQGDREFTLNDMYAIDLSKLDGVRELFNRQIDDWQMSEDEEDEDEDEDMEDDSESDEDDGSVSGVALPRDTTKEDDTISQTTAGDTAMSEGTLVEDEEIHKSAMDDGLPQPRVFESLRDFFARTTEAWQDVVLDKMKYGASGQNKGVKEIKKDAFDLAEIKWWDCREEITALEDEQEEAGIGEVINVKERGDQGGKRR